MPDTGALPASQAAVVPAVIQSIQRTVLLESCGLNLAKSANYERKYTNKLPVITVQRYNIALL